ncbi:MAG TPA: SDR family NAD(P)-dependent oxidoreductase [Clostridia bacterium]|jgi:short-subunit dehydrogenase|nr:SDR family NAD(P)-dependent oxidoreductase [Clostridia bacterium]
MKKVAVITGASTGIGNITGKKLLDSGWIVYNLARRQADGFKNIKTDVSIKLDVDKAITQIIKEEGHIDVLVNNAGYGISGAIENTDIESAKRQFDVNFFGSIYVAQAVIPYMRDYGRGKIINISSMAAEFPIPFQAFYSASKAAISSFSASLGMEVKPFNIKVTSVLPGDIKTEFTAKRVKNITDSEQYGVRIDKAVSKMEKDEQSGKAPETIAKVILKVIKKKNPSPYIVVGWDYKLLSLLARILPKRLVYWVVYKMYGG